MSQIVALQSQLRHAQLLNEKIENAMRSCNPQNYWQGYASVSAQDNTEQLIYQCKRVRELLNDLEKEICFLYTTD